ncbi:MAG: hypothetical protein PVG39_00230 [Desulfobacteraceae bacterium]
MVDSLLDIGGEPEFPLSIDWSSQPSYNFQISRYLFEGRGTASKIEEKNPETPISFEAKFYVGDRETEYAFLDFIHTTVGRTNRFWLRYPKQSFIPTEGLSNGSMILKVEPNNFDLFHVGHERIYIQTIYGDTITRHVSNATYDATFDEISLQLLTAIDRDISLDEFLIIGRYLLVRFDHDDFNINVLTEDKFDFSLKFIELIRDYSDLAANP